MHMYMHVCVYICIDICCNVIVEVLFWCSSLTGCKTGSMGDKQEAERDIQLLLLSPVNLFFFFFKSLMKKDNDSWGFYLFLFWEDQITLALSKSDKKCT